MVAMPEVDSPISSSSASSFTAATATPSTLKTNRNAATYTDRDITKWFINSKRSLSSMTLGARANELVSNARLDTQKATTLSSRCVFLRRALQDQIEILRQMRDMAAAARKTVKNDFEKALKDLDHANTRLDDMLARLRRTNLESAFNPSAEEIQPRNLHDFVDDQGIENLRIHLRTLIDDIGVSERDFVASIEIFTEDLEALYNAIRGLPTPVSSGSLPPALSLTPNRNALEEHASAMASLLEALARHYDQCSLALKQSEVGQRAMHSSEITNESHTRPDVDLQDMLEVLGKDAGQVDDVIIELQERLADMEQVASNITHFTSHLDDAHTSTVDAFSKAEDFEGKLVSMITRTREYQFQFQQHQQSLVDRMIEMDRLTEHYTRFAEAYDALLVEYARRLNVQNAKEHIMEEALNRIDALNEQDLVDRENFRTDWGEYLPLDIWPGLSNPPVMYTVEPIQVLATADLNGETKRGEGDV